MAQFASYAAVGTVGFLVDASVLWVAINATALGLYLGRIVSFIASASITWYLNRTFTYRDRRSAGRRSSQWLRYIGVSIIGALVNYGIYCGCVNEFTVAALYPTLAVAAGSIAGMLVNFSAYSLLVFRASPGA